MIFANVRSKTSGRSSFQPITVDSVFADSLDMNDCKSEKKTFDDDHCPVIPVDAMTAVPKRKSFHTS